jgi:hypothetical protein
MKAIMFKVGGAVRLLFEDIVRVEYDDATDEVKRVWTSDGLSYGVDGETWVVEDDYPVEPWKAPKRHAPDLPDEMREEDEVHRRLRKLERAVEALQRKR